MAPLTIIDNGTVYKVSDILADAKVMATNLAETAKIIRSSPALFDIQDSDQRRVMMMVRRHLPPANPQLTHRELDRC